MPPAQQNVLCNATRAAVLHLTSTFGAGTRYSVPLAQDMWYVFSEGKIFSAAGLVISLQHYNYTGSMPGLKYNDITASVATHLEDF
eukprot:11689525-Ditylum_brightwellii.AAC.1